MGTFFHRHRGATPYLLLAPGVLWLAIFFLIPLGFLGYESLQSGLFPNFEFTWEFSNFSDGIRDYHEQFDPLVRLRRDRDRRVPPARVSARLLDRVPGGPVAESLPALHRRAVLRHVPRADARLAEHPRRPGARSSGSSGTSTSSAPTAGSWRRRSRSCRASPTTSSPSWRSRSTSRSSRSTRGSSRPRRTSTRRRRRRSCA